MGDMIKASKSLLMRSLDPHAIQKIFEWQRGWNTSTETNQLINGLLFDEIKEVRTSTIVLLAFNILAAFLTAASILYDSYRASNQCRSCFQAMKLSLSAMHPADTFPFILSVGIVIQGCIFSVSQGIGMQGVMANGCNIVAQFTFPAILLIPYIHIVFGVETAVRGVRKEPFLPRGKYVVTICLAVIVVMVIATWFPTHQHQERRTCFASLVWFVERYGRIGTILLAISAGIVSICGIIIFWRLSTATTINQHQRIAASRIVYYLVLAVVSLAFVIPWFAGLVKGRPNMIASMIATIVLNLHGLLMGILHLLLRSNTAITSFRPKKMQGWDFPAHEIRFFGPNELRFDKHSLHPVSGPRSPSRSSSLNSPLSLVKEKRKRPSLESLRIPEPGPQWRVSSDTGPMKLTPHQDPIPSKIPPPSNHHKWSYSLFPTNRSNSNTETPQATTVQPTPASMSGKMPASFLDASSPNYLKNDELTYGLEHLVPPTPPYARDHRRESSWISSATVQIGLRLSNAVIPDDSRPSPETPFGSRPGSPLQLPFQASNPTGHTMRSISPTIASDALMKVLPPIPGALGLTLSQTKVPTSVLQVEYAAGSLPRRPPKAQPPDRPSPVATSRNPLPIMAIGDLPSERPKGKADWI